MKDEVWENIARKLLESVDVSPDPGEIERLELVMSREWYRKARKEQDRRFRAAVDAMFPV